MRALAATVAALVAVLALAGAGTAATGSLELTPVGRLPFPERGYVVDLQGRASVDPTSVRVTENGRRVTGVDVAPVAAAGIHFGVVLALDASESMTGAPLAGALDAARTFVTRREGEQEVGIVAFNGEVRVVQEPTNDAAALRRALVRAPELAYGTRIHDAVEESLALLARARLSSGTIVLLSDGADIGSKSSIDDAIAKARARHVRVFAVGLRSGAFDSAALRKLARETGGTFAEASSPERLAAIYDALGRRLASEYVVRYRSDAAPRSEVDVSIWFHGLGTASTKYVAPTPAGLQPYHRSDWARFIASPAAPFVLALLIAGLAALTVIGFARPRRSTLVERVDGFASGRGIPAPTPIAETVAPKRPRRESALLASLERKLEIARVDMSAGRLVLLTAGGTAVVVLVLWTFAPIFALIGLSTPLITRGWLAKKLRAVRDLFSDQLAPNLQVLASALRSGHSFAGGLAVVVEHASEPSRSELRRAVADEQLGVPVEEAIRRVADRMKSRDLEQIALLAELQRTAGGNAAEVLDTVVETIRERSDLRRLVRTLTAQGRMARWILSALPVCAGIGLWLIQPAAVEPLLHTPTGQLMLVVAAGLVVTGSFAIQKIVDIKV
jgi:tight adherence protein B